MNKLKKYLLHYLLEQIIDEAISRNDHQIVDCALVIEEWEGEVCQTSSNI